MSPSAVRLAILPWAEISAPFTKALDSQRVTNRFPRLGRNCVRVPSSGFRRLTFDNVEHVSSEWYQRLSGLGYLFRRSFVTAVRDHFNPSGLADRRADDEHLGLLLQR